MPWIQLAPNSALQPPIETVLIRPPSRFRASRILQKTSPKMNFSADRELRFLMRKMTEMTKLTEMTENDKMTEMTKMTESDKNDRNDKIDRNQQNDKNDRNVRIDRNDSMGPTTFLDWILTSESNQFLVPPSTRRRS